MEIDSTTGIPDFTPSLYRLHIRHPLLPLSGTHSERALEDSMCHFQGALTVYSIKRVNAVFYSVCCIFCSMRQLCSSAANNWRGIALTYSTL